VSEGLHWDCVAGTPSTFCLSTSTHAVQLTDLQIHSVHGPVYHGACTHLHWPYHHRSSMFVLAGSFWMCWVPHPPHRGSSSLSSTCSTLPAHNLTSCMHHLCDCSSIVRSAVLCVCRNFLEVLGPSSPFPLPQQLQQHLQHLREQLLQEAVFRTGSVTFEVMTAGEQ
jgi:hypothetical protein